MPRVGRASKNVSPIAPTGGEAFHPDVAFGFVFSPPAGGRQSVTVRRATGAAARSHEATGDAILTDVPVDRGAHPSLTAYFNAEDVKDAYNAGEPADDWAAYREPWTAVLRHFGDYEPAAAEHALRTVLPDVLRFDRSRPAAYPNGRTLIDDVTSARLSMLTGGKVPTDHIGQHTDLLPDFPYLGPPHAG